MGWWLVGGLAGWVGWAGWLVGWLGWLDGWLAGLAGWMAGWLAGWLVGWLAGWLVILRLVTLRLVWNIGFDVCDKQIPIHTTYGSGFLFVTYICIRMDRDLLVRISDRAHLDPLGPLGPGPFLFGPVGHWAWVIWGNIF